MGSEWQESKLGDVIELKRGYDLPQQLRRVGTVPIVSSSGISGRHDTAMAHAPGVVTGRYGTIGQVYYITENYWPLNTTLYVRDFKGNDPRFISYFLRQIDFLSCSDKAAVPGVNRNHLHAIDVTLPPLPEQKAIAHILGTLDDRIELNRRMNETLEGMARALFRSWFVEFDPVRAKLDGREPVGMDAETAALFPGRFEGGGESLIPVGWQFSRLGDHVGLQRGNTYKSKLKDLPGPYLLGLASIHRNGGFRDDSLRTYGGDSPSHLMLGPGDLFVSLKDVTQSADLLGAVARVPPDVSAGRLTQDTVKLVDKNTGLSQNYLYWLLRSPQCRDYCRSRATGTTNLGLSREDFLSFPVVVPTLGVQIAFDAIAGPIDALINMNRRTSSILTALRDGMLPRLLSGDITV